MRDHLVDTNTLETVRETIGATRQAAVQGASTCQATRKAISFRSINRIGSPSYTPDLQRHHLLPRQLLGKDCFETMFRHLGRTRVGFEDFRSNGLLLPATERGAMLTGMPLHRGPHPAYNELVIERVGNIEQRWDKVRKKDPETARNEALERMRLLQGALRRRLLSERKSLSLNRKDPLGTGFNFDQLDAMAEELWAST